MYLLLILLTSYWLMCVGKFVGFFFQHLVLTFNASNTRHSSHRRFCCVEVCNIKLNMISKNTPRSIVNQNRGRLHPSHTGRINAPKIWCDSPFNCILDATLRLQFTLSFLLISNHTAPGTIYFSRVIHNLFNWWKSRWWETVSLLERKEMLLISLEYDRFLCFPIKMFSPA